MNHLSPETLTLYLDDMLDPPARESAAAHLATCALCQGELAALRTLFSALEALPPEPLPVDLTNRVLQRIAPVRQSTQIHSGPDVPPVFHHEEHEGLKPSVYFGPRVPVPAVRGRTIERPYAVAVLTTQVALATLLSVWFGPMLARATQARLTALGGLAPPDPAALLAWPGGWGAAFQAALSALARASDMPGAVLFAGIPPLQWALVLAGVAIIWLLGNRLLLAGSYEPRNTRQEAA